MRFKTSKLAAAVAVALGTSAVVVSTAQADEILYPYIVSSPTVTTLVSTINVVNLDYYEYSDKLHYRYWYKNGVNAENNAAVCAEVNKPLPSSSNDIVTFDAGGQFQSDNLNILFEDTKVSTLPLDGGTGYGNASFALLKGLTAPVRAFLVVDNNYAFAADYAYYYNYADTLAGEAIILEFVNGAAWGYAAYNPTPRYAAEGITRINAYDFSDFVETAGEVIASEQREAIGSVFFNVGRVPVAIAPRFTADGKDDIITKFFVTPVAPTRYSAYDGVWVPPGGTYRYLDADGVVQSTVLPWQLRGDLTATVGLATYDVELGAVVMYDRDEGPVSGQAPQTVTCVGAVDVKSLLTEGALLQVPKGGWANFSLGRYAKSTVSGLPTAGTNYTDEAIAIKLEYNTPTSVSIDSVGIINNAIWLRKGIKESVPAGADGVRFQIERIGLANNVVSFAD